MKKLRRSRTAKVISFVLALIFGALITANAVFAVVLLKNNLYLSDEASIRHKVFSYLAENTVNDIIKYFDCRTNYLSSLLLKNGNADYWESEISLYGSKYSHENSNIYFSVSDQNGDVVFNTPPPSSDPVFEPQFVYTRSFTRTLYTDGKGNRFIVNEDNKDGIIEPSTYFEEEPSNEEASTYTDKNELTQTATEEHSLKDNETAQTTSLLTGTAKKAPSADFLADKYRESYTEATPDNKSDTLVLLALEWNVDTSLNGKYLFESKSGINTKIYAFCTERFMKERELGNTEPLVYFQSDYTVSKNGEVTKSANNDKNSDVPSGYKPQTVTYTVKLYVPFQEDFTAKDIYLYAGRALIFGVAYRTALIGTTVAYFIFLTAAVVFLLYSAGYTVKSEAPYAGGIHKIPFDVFTVIYLLSAILSIFVITTNPFFLAKYTLVVMLPLISTVYLFCVMSLIFIESLAVRIRCRTVFTNTLTGRFFKLIKRMTESSGLVGKTLLIFLAELVLLVLFTVLAKEINPLLTAALGAVILLPPTLAFVYEFHVISEGARRFSQGETNTKIKEKMLFGTFKRFAGNLNSINDTVNTAVKEQLKSESMKTELITNVSHDLKTPLTSIVNYIDLLKKLNIDDETAREYIEVIDRQSQRLKKLTVDIVDASKAATGSIEVNPEILDLRVMISQTDGEYCDRLEQKNLTLIIDVPDSPAYVNVDGRLLWRVFDNIINNVCKYSLSGTRVYLTLTEHDGTVYTTLRNISANELNIEPNELTERFVRGDSSRNTDGSGLGLSIASSLTELMGGKFKIDIDGDLFKVTISFPSCK